MPGDETRIDPMRAAGQNEHRIIIGDEHERVGDRPNRTVEGLGSFKSRSGGLTHLVDRAVYAKAGEDGADPFRVRVHVDQSGRSGSVEQGIEFWP